MIRNIDRNNWKMWQPVQSIFSKIDLYTYIREKFHFNFFFNKRKFMYKSDKISIKEGKNLTRHISKQQQVKNLLTELENTINRNNVDLAIPLLEWTKEKINLSYREKNRVDKYIRTKKIQGKPRFVKRGGVYYANLGKNVGSEQNGYRPVLVVQEKGANATSPTVIIIPLTDAHDKHGQPKRVLNTHLVISHPSLSKVSMVKAEYARSISKNRLRDFVCQLDSQIMSDVDVRIKKTFQLT
jgi:mRNA-degrading endonuclease toxin of MazEF toxin-antitoxin module